MSQTKFKLVGIPRRRVDGRAKVTGQTRFADDLEPGLGNLPVDRCEVGGEVAIGHG